MERASSSGDADGVGLHGGARDGCVRPVPDELPAGPGEPDGRDRRLGTPRDVRLLWSSNAADALGTQISGVAFPLLLLGLGHPPTTVGLLAGAGMLVTVVCGPVVAVAADRGLRKPVMAGSAAVAAVAMGAVALSAADGRPPLALLLGALLVERTATACFEAAARGTVALVAAPREVPRVVAGLEAGDRAALVAGPLVGGVLYQVARPLPFAADALSYVVTALCVRSMRSDLRAGSPATAPGGGPAPSGDPATVHAASASAPSSPDRDTTRPPGTPVSATAGGAAPAPGTESPGTRPTPLRALRSYARETLAGLALVRSSPRLRLVLVWTTTVNAALAGLYYSALFALQDRGGPVAMGLVLAVSGGAGLAGALAAPAVVRRVGGARTLVAVTWLTVPPAAALAWTGSPWSLGLCFGAFCLLLAPATVVVQSAAIADTPHHLQARTGALLATAVVGAGAGSPVVAGALATHAGPAATPAACALALAVLALFTGLRAGRLRPGGRS
ncbi:MFS transporter [Streptomyces wuyuanensis]|uniref:Major Facilitator Superfamily protein n=1 Tax=Streptomyces wuyuanensis TaxID=1196353 RepID=A0A1G9XML0_9ACTN|nr:MFS transporter [Streptomyces wuyuanensis]SDM98089.1 Major Facilitator Superfamily protein [Streptomyces wuyuanensis]